MCAVGRLSLPRACGYSIGQMANMMGACTRRIAHSEVVHVATWFPVGRSPTIAPRYCLELLKAFGPAEQETSALTKGWSKGALSPWARNTHTPSAGPRAKRDRGAGAASAQAFPQKRVWVCEVMRGSVAEVMRRRGRLRSGTTPSAPRSKAVRVAGSCIVSDHGVRSSCQLERSPAHEAPRALKVTCSATSARNEQRCRRIT